MSWTADEILRAVEDALRPLVRAEGGELMVATDPEHAIELLTVSPAKWRAILGWPGYGGHSAAVLGMGSHRIYVILQIARGLAANAGDSLHRGRAGLSPHAGLIERVSRWVRAMRPPDGSGLACKGFALTGSSWLSIEGIETKQHQLDFSIDAALPSDAAVIVLTAE